MSLKHELLRYLKRFETVGKIWKNENKDAYACNMTRFDTIFWLPEKILKAMKLNGAFWRFYDRRLLGDPIVLPIHHHHPPSFFIANVYVLFFSFFELTYKPVEETEEECPESETSFPVMLLFNSDYTQEEKDNNLTGCAEICTHGRINYSTQWNKNFNKLQHTAKQDFQ